MQLQPHSPRRGGGHAVHAWGQPDLSGGARDGPTDDGCELQACSKHWTYGVWLNVAV